MAKTAWQRKQPEEASHPQQEAQVKTAVHVHMVIDRSGSMESIRSDVIGGFNAFLADLRSNSDLPCRLSLYQFDSGGYDALFQDMDVGEVRDADQADFAPRGMTPLWDAVGQTITRAQVRAETPTGQTEQPIVVILTDGLENASQEYSGERLRALIGQKEATGWIFTYLGANQDAMLAASSMGIHRATTQNFVADSKGVAAAFVSTSAAVNSTRVRTARGQSVGASTFYSETGQGAEQDYQSRTGDASAGIPPAPVAPPSPLPGVSSFRREKPRSWKR